MEECKSQEAPSTVHDVEEGEISDSATSVEQISEEVFSNKDLSPVAPAPAPAPAPSKSTNLNSFNSNNSSNNHNINNHNSNQNSRVWTMRDLYKYQLSRNYSAGLYNLAWASAVQNKPLDEVLVMEFPKPTSENNGSISISNSNSKRAGSESNSINKDPAAPIDKSDTEAAAAQGKLEEIIEEKEEGELEEGEIDLDSEVVEMNGDVSKENELRAVPYKGANFNNPVDLIMKGLESVTLEEAQESFAEVSSRLQNLLDSVQEMDEENFLTAKDVLTRLTFTAVKTLNNVFCYMNRNQKECNKEIMSRLLAHLSSQKHWLFSAEQLKEIEVMVSALDSSSVSWSSKDTRTNKEIQELELVTKNDFYISSEGVKNVSKEISDVDLIPVESSDQPEPRTYLEYAKSGVSNSKYRGLSLPLLDLHKDHDADSLPSPTQGATSFLPIEKGFAAGHGMLKPEWPVPRVALETDNVPMHPYETDAVKNVSSYQQKFGRSSFLMNDRLPSPTPSGEGDRGDGDINGEVSSSSNMDVRSVSTLMVAQPTVSSAPKKDILSGQALTNVQSAALLSSGPDTSSKSTSAKSRDPRLRLANSGAAALDPLLHVVNNEPKVEPVSRKQKTVEELVLDGPAFKRQRNELTDSGILNDVQAVTGTGGWLDDRATVGLGARSHPLESTGNDPRRPEYSVNGVSSTSMMPNVTGNVKGKLPVTTNCATASLHSLLKDITVNPSIWMDIIKIEQKKYADPTNCTTQPPSSNSITGAVVPTNVVASKPSALGERVVGILQTQPEAASVEELGKIRMKPRDPRRVLHSTTLKKGGSMEFDQSQTKTSNSSTPVIIGSTNFQRLDDQLDKKCMPSHSITPPDIASQFTKNLKNIADIISVSQATSSQPAHTQISSALPAQAHQGSIDSIGILESGNLQTCPGLATGSSRSQNNRDDVEHLFEGFDDQQKAAIHRERARRMEEQRKMFAERKLCLVLDLDHTLLNSAKFVEVDPMHDEILRKKEEQDREKLQRHLFQFPHMGMWTKLRPGIWNFLEKASKLYELHLYTMGNKLYATEMAKLLDPKGELFAGRVISRGDDGDSFDGDERVPKSKDLEGVMGMESAVVIIDDSMRVWPHNKLNLIVVERYIYFPCSRRQFGLLGPSLLEVDVDERPEDGTLASSLAVIERIHEIFFAHQSLDEADVRNILASEQRKILAGCRILFSRVFPVGESNPHLHPLWQTAEEFGAVCTNSIDEHVTHVVANSLGTDKVNWALSTGRFVVHPGWVEASALLYRRANELDFVIKQ